MGSLDSMPFWKNGSMGLSLTFGNDLLLTLGAAEYLHAPCVTLSGAFAIPDYIEEPGIIYNYLGLFERNYKMTFSNSVSKTKLAKVIVMYPFYDLTSQAVQDFSGNNILAYLGNITNFL